MEITSGVYKPRDPRTTGLYEVVCDDLRAEPVARPDEERAAAPKGDGGSVNLETLYGAIEDGAIAVRIPKHARKELEASLSCGLLCRGLARLKCEGPLRPKIAPKPPTEEPAAASAEPDRTGPADGYRPWAQLLARTFAPWTSSPAPSATGG